jgi:drug/metabolite transporter (DMT)-like permease
VAHSLVSSVFAGAFMVFYRMAGDVSGRNAALFGMLTCAAVLSVLIAPLHPSPKKSDPRKWWISVVAFAVLALIGNWGISQALRYLVPGVSSTILQVQVFFVAIAGAVFLRERVSLIFIVGALCAVTGFAIFALPTDAAAGLSMKGIGFGLLAAICFAAILVISRAVIADINPMTANAARLVLATLLLSLWPGQVQSAFEMPVKGWLWCAAAAACGPTASRLGLLFAVRHISAAQVKLITLLNPVFAFLLSFALLGTAPLIREIAGGCLIVLGVLLPTLHAARHLSSRARET